MGERVTWSPIVPAEVTKATEEMMTRYASLAPGFVLFDSAELRAIRDDGEQMNGLTRLAMELTSYQ